MGGGRLREPGRRLPTPSYPQPEQDLWQLSLGLNASFLSQRDCEVIGDPDSFIPEQGVCTDDGLRDLTVADRGNSTIGERFDAEGRRLIHHHRSLGNPGQRPAGARRRTTRTRTR